MPEPFSQLVDIAHLPSDVELDIVRLGLGGSEEDRAAFWRRWRALRESIELLGKHLEQWQKTSGVRREVAFFAVVMEDKLRANEHKGGWTDCSVEQLVKRLKEETAELEDALKESKGDEICREAADVANFAMMIADSFGRI